MTRALVVGALVVGALVVGALVVALDAQRFLRTRAGLAVIGQGPTPNPPPPPAEEIYILDDFASNFIVQPNESNPKGKYLWKTQFYSTTDTITIPAGGGVTFRGGTALKSVWSCQGATGGAGAQNWQLYFYPYTIYKTPEWPSNYNGWHYAHELIRPFVNFPNPLWTAHYNLGDFGRVNRLRFWMQVPSGTVPVAGGGHNFEWGTGIGSQANWDNGNDGVEFGWHFYHFYNLSARDGVWQQVIVDTNPQWQVATNDPIDQFRLNTASNPATNGDEAYTYFDLLRWAYFDFPYHSRSYTCGWSDPATFYLAGLEFYVEANSEDVAYIQSLNGSFQPSSNTVHIQWQTPLGDTSTYDVKYAWSSIHAGGWAGATAVSGCQDLVGNVGGVQGMDCSTTAIDVTGHGNGPLYMGVKREASATWRVINVDVGSLQ